jgi:hypothetical protein
MPRRPFALLVLSLLAFSLSACADVTLPTEPTRRIQPAGQASHDVEPCAGGYGTSTGKAC